MIELLRNLGPILGMIARGETININVQLTVTDPDGTYYTFTRNEAETTA